MAVVNDSTLLNLAVEMGAALRHKGWTLALAESCTGGMAAQYATAIAGSSAWVECGFVTYSNEAKVEMLDVSAVTIEQHGAVSEETAREMSLGALQHSRAQIAIAITGIAGPDGGTPEKPVGTVCFAWADVTGKINSETRHFSGDRETIRKQSVHHAFKELLLLH
ncbi:MAG: CinA family protein [Methylophilaceae bacterium]